MGDGPVVGAQYGAGYLYPGVERVDDRKVLSGIIPVIQKGLGWGQTTVPTKPSTTVAATGQTRVFLS